MVLVRLQHVPDVGLDQKMLIISYGRALMQGKYGFYATVVTLVTTSSLKPLIDGFRCLLVQGREWRCKLGHVLREANACADFLAKLGPSLPNDLTIWATPPPGLRMFLLSDASGTFHLRL